MTVQNYIWILSEFGQVAELPAGTCPVDALPTGPLYERLLRSQPPVKLLYTHTQGSNVNDVATMLAGHTINGDACLVAACSSLSVRPTSHAAFLSSLLDDLLPSPTKAQHPQPQAHLHRRRLVRTMFAGALDSASNFLAEPLAACPVSPQDSDRRGQLGTHPHHPASPPPPCLPTDLSTGLHPQSTSMCDILGSENAASATAASASTTSLSTVPGTMCAVALVTEEGKGEHVRKEIDAGAAGGCDSPKLHNTEINMSEGGSIDIDEEVDTNKFFLARTMYASSGSTDTGGDMVSQSPSYPNSRQCPAHVMATPCRKSARSDGGDGTLTEAAAGGALPYPVVQKHCPSQMLVEVEAEGKKETRVESAEGACVKPEASEGLKGQVHQGQQHYPGGQVLEVLAAAQWAELAADVVTGIALHLPPRASQILAMSAVCRGWRAALLAHRPLLARIAFNLDFTPPHRQTGGPNGETAAARKPSPTATELPDSGNLGPRGALTEVVTAAVGGDFLAAAVARQHMAGAWLLPSQAGDVRVPQEAEEAGGGGGSSSGCVSRGGGGESGGTAAGPPPPGSPRAVLTSLPRLLWAAAAAANPSAQLVLAQLLEASGDLGGALRWWRKLATGGDVMGMFKTGMASYEGSHGAPCDPETAHLWLSRTVRQLLRVDSLSAIPETAPRVRTAAAAHHQYPAAGGGGAMAGAAARMSTGLTAMIAALDAPLVHMLGWSAMVLGYLEFDGVAGRSLWGFGERSEAVRLFRLAEGCGLAEAGTVLGWLYNTGQY